MAKKEWTKRWDKVNMAHLSCSVRTEKAIAFSDWCKEHGTNPSAMFTKFVNIALGIDQCDNDKVDLELLYMSK